MKLAVFDFDSTLMDGETIDILAAACGFGEEVRAVTERAMQGELDFYASLKERVAHLKGLRKSQVDAICADLPYMEGAEEAIKGLKTKGYKTVVFSGGFRNATSIARQRLSLHADFSNILHARDGFLTGEVGGEMMFDYSKGDMLARLQMLLGVGYEQTLAVGDGANDRSMFQYAATKIAFNAKPILKESANVIIDVKDLRAILDYAQ